MGLHVAAIVQARERVRHGELDALVQAVAQVVGMALALDLRAHAGEQLVAIDRAGQIVVHAHVESAQQARFLARLHDDDDGQVAGALQRAHLAAQAQAVGRCQVQADDEEIAGPVAEAHERRRQFGLDLHLMRFAEHRDHALGHALVVLHQQNAPADHPFSATPRLHRGVPRSGRRSPCAASSRRSVS